MNNTDIHNNDMYDNMYNNIYNDIYINVIHKKFPILNSNDINILKKMLYLTMILC